MPFGMSELLILLVGAIVCIGIPLFGAVDAARMKEQSFALADQKKSTWVVILIACAVFMGVGLIGAAVYFMSVRPKVAAFERDPNRPTLDPHR
jgi:hypothetical protein